LNKPQRFFSFDPHDARADPPCSVFVEVEDSGIVEVFRSGGIDEDDLSWKPIRVRQVDVAVLDHGTIARIFDGVEKLVFDLMEFGISQTQALPQNPIISIHQAG
jgi:hypothetical protein